MSKLWLAVATLVGTIIGAGILGIPYVTAQAGISAGIIIIIALGMLNAFLNLYLGEICLRTKGTHQLSGYVEKYLGKGKHFMALLLAVQIYGALLAYTIGEGISFSSILGGNSAVYSLVFFLMASLLISKGLKTVGWSELILSLGLVCVVIVVSFLLTPNLTAENFSGGDNNPLTPYGVVLFAFLGITSIPLLSQLLNKEKKNLKKAIIMGSVIPVIVYILFAIFIIGAIGLQGFEQLTVDERIASAAVKHFFGGGLGILVNIFAILSMGTSFLALSLALQEMFTYDYGVKKWPSLILTLSIPLIFFIYDAFVTDITNFIQILGITGAIAGGLTGIMIVIMFHRARRQGERKPAYTIPASWLISALLITFFALGIFFGF